MSIQKKSLLNSLNTTKKAIVASATPASEDPKVSAKVSARAISRARAARVSVRVRGYVSPKH